MALFPKPLQRTPQGFVKERFRAGRVKMHLHTGHLRTGMDVLSLHVAGNGDHALRCFTLQVLQGLPKGGHTGRELSHHSAHELRRFYGAALTANAEMGGVDQMTLQP